MSMSILALGTCFHASLILSLCQQFISVTQVQDKCMQLGNSKSLKTVLEANKSNVCVHQQIHMHTSISVPFSLSHLALQFGSRFASLAVAVLARGKAAALAPQQQILCYWQFLGFRHNSITETCLKLRSFIQAV